MGQVATTGNMNRLQPASFTPLGRIQPQTPANPTAEGSASPLSPASPAAPKDSTTSQSFDKKNSRLSTACISCSLRKVKVCYYIIL